MRTSVFVGTSLDGFIAAARFLRLPVLIGAGIPLFGALDRDIQLRHVATRQFSSGLVQSEYEVAPVPPLAGGRSTATCP